MPGYIIDLTNIKHTCTLESLMNMIMWQADFKIFIVLVKCITKININTYS